MPKIPSEYVFQEKYDSYYFSKFANNNNNRLGLISYRRIAIVRTYIYYFCHTICDYIQINSLSFYDAVQNNLIWLLDLN